MTRTRHFTEIPRNTNLSRIYSVSLMSDLNCCVSVKVRVRVPVKNYK